MFMKLPNYIYIIIYAWLNTLILVGKKLGSVETKLPAMPFVASQVLGGELAMAPRSTNRVSNGSNVDKYRPFYLTNHILTYVYHSVNQSILIFWLFHVVLMPLHLCPHSSFSSAHHQWPHLQWCKRSLAGADLLECLGFITFNTQLAPVPHRNPLKSEVHLRLLQ